MAMIHARIKERREAVGLTLAQLAEATGVRKATAQRWESGNIKTIKYETVELLTAALHCTPQYLMGWDSEEKPAISNDGGRVEEFVSLFSRLTAEQQALIVAQIKGILSEQ